MRNERVCTRGPYRPGFGSARGNGLARTTILSGERSRRETVTRSPRAFVYIMAPIYPLMTTREGERGRSADTAARGSYDVSGGPLVIVPGDTVVNLRLLICGC